MIEIVLMQVTIFFILVNFLLTKFHLSQLEMSYTACLTRMNFATPFCSFLRTNRIFQMLWVPLRWLISWGFTDSATDNGISKHVVRQLAMACTKGWIGSLQRYRRENRCFLPSVRCVQLCSLHRSFSHLRVIVVLALSNRKNE